MGTGPTDPKTLFWRSICAEDVEYWLYEHAAAFGSKNTVFSVSRFGPSTPFKDLNWGFYLWSGPHDDYQFLVDCFVQYLGIMKVWHHAHPNIDHGMDAYFIFPPQRLEYLIEIQSIEALKKDYS